MESSSHSLTDARLVLLATFLVPRKRGTLPPFWKPNDLVPSSDRLAVRAEWQLTLRESPEAVIVSFIEGGLVTLEKRRKPTGVLLLETERDDEDHEVLLGLTASGLSVVRAFLMRLSKSSWITDGSVTALRMKSALLSVGTALKWIGLTGLGTFVGNRIDDYLMQHLRLIEEALKTAPPDDHENEKLKLHEMPNQGPGIIGVPPTDTPPGFVQAGFVEPTAAAMMSLSLVLARLASWMRKAPPH